MVGEAENRSSLDSDAPPGIHAQQLHIPKAESHFPPGLRSSSSLKENHLEHVQKQSLNQIASPTVLFLEVILV